MNTWAHLRTLPLDALLQLAKDGYVKNEKAVEKAKERADSCVHFGAKVCGALQRQFTLAITARSGAIPANTKFPAYHEAHTEAKPSGRIMALANVFLAFVDIDKPVLTEAAFDALPAEWLEKASAVLNSARDRHGADFMASAEVTKLVAALTSPGDAGKTIAKIREEQKPAKAKAGEEAGKGDAGVSMPMPEAVRRWLGQSTDNLILTLTMMGAELRSFTDAERLPEVTATLQLTGEMFEQNPIAAAYFARKARQADAAARQPANNVTVEVSSTVTTPGAETPNNLLPAA